jgi:hypothetical protein
MKYYGCLFLVFVIILVTFIAVRAGMLDTSNTLLRYGVSHEPLTFSDTVTVSKYYQSGNMIYLKTLTGEIWAAWAVPENRK